MKRWILIASLVFTAGCASKWNPSVDIGLDRQVNESDVEMRRGITGDPPDVRPVGRAERIESGYENHELQ